MATLVAWNSLINDKNGMTATYSLSGVIAGSLDFQASRLPDRSNAFDLVPTNEASSTDGTSGLVTNTGTLPFPNPGLWYVWFSESGNTSEDTEAVWVRASDDLDLDEIGTTVRDILWDNRRGIEKACWELYPDLTLKTVTFGFDSAVKEFPAIIVSQPKVREEYFATGFVKVHYYTLYINAVLVHEDEATEVPTVDRLIRAAMDILNNPYYEQLTLPSGLPVYRCQAVSGASTESDLGGSRYAAIGSIIWTCEAMRQQTVGV